MLTWQDPSPDHGVPAPAGAWHETIETHDVGGAILHAPAGAPSGLRGTFAVATSRAPGVTVTIRDRFDAVADEEVWADFAADGRLDPATDPRPSAAGEAIGAAVAATVELAPGERRSVRFALAWDLPVVEFGAGRRWYKRYTRDWGRTGERAFDLASHALEQAPAWRAAIEAWQRPGPRRRTTAPTGTRRPSSTSSTSSSTAARSGRPARSAGRSPIRDDPGRFALLECLDYPFYDTRRRRLLRLVRDPAAVPGARGARDPRPAGRGRRSTTRRSSRSRRPGCRAPRKVGGTVPHDVGGPDDDPFYRPNRYTYQDVNDWKDLGPKFVLQVWRDAVAAGADGDALIRDAWPTVEALLTRLSARDRDGDGLPEHDGLPDQTYDTWPMHGPSAYGGSLWLGALAAAEAMAGRLGATESARRWTAWFERGQVAFDRRLWRGDHYAYDDGGGAELGQHHGRPAGRPVVRRRDRARRPRARATASRRTLRTIHRMNVCGFAGGTMGAVNGVRPDGSVDHSSEQSAEVWVGTTYALAAFMIGRGLTEEGWSTASGAAAVTYERGLWFRTPEAYDEAGNFRASLYLRPLAIWAIEEALERRGARA